MKVVIVVSLFVTLLLLSILELYISVTALRAQLPEGLESPISRNFAKDHLKVKPISLSASLGSATNVTAQLNGAEFTLKDSQQSINSLLLKKDDIDDGTSQSRHRILPTIQHAIVEECQASLVPKITQIQQHLLRRKSPCPILESMVPVDGAYRLILITEHMRHRYAEWSTAAGARWHCDNQLARLHLNQSQNDSGDGGTFIITCPLSVQLVVGRLTTTGETVKYNTSHWRTCSDENKLLGVPETSVKKLVCTMFKGDHSELLQWIEYHRLIGFEHFLIYLHEPYNSTFTTLPDSNHITYIPWNFADIGYKGSIPHQAVQQMDCIQRAQARNVTWAALMDVDEYFQVMDNHTLDEILEFYEADDHMGGLQMPSWFFGENVFDGSDTSWSPDNTTINLVIDSVWRGTNAYGDGRLGAGREKMIVRPRQVVYFACHKIVLGGPMLRDSRIRLNHYKLRSKGVFGSYSRARIAHDNSLQARFGTILRERMLHNWSETYSSS